MYLYSRFILYTFYCIRNTKNQETASISLILEVKCSLNKWSFICSPINGHYRALVIYMLETVLEQVIHKAEQNAFCGTCVNHKTQISHITTIIFTSYNDKG